MKMIKEPKIIFEIRNVNWSMMEKGDWESTTYRIYDNLTLQLIDKYAFKDNIQKRVKNLHQRQINKLVKLFNIAKEINSDEEDCCDGEAWEFAYYDNNRIVWHKKLGYIYNIKEYEKIERYIKWISI